jgi:hypothetical protein
MYYITRSDPFMFPFFLIRLGGVMLWPNMELMFFSSKYSERTMLTMEIRHKNKENKALFSCSQQITVAFFS